MTADSFFGGAPGLSWPKADQNHVYSDTRLRGVARGGVIVDEPVVQQMTAMGTGEPLWWDRERTRAKNQMIVTLLCDGRGKGLDERDPQNPSDQGRRRLYIRGYMVAAIRDALQKAGAEGLRLGGELYVAWVNEQPSKTANFDPARLWAAEYTPGSVSLPDGGAKNQPQNGVNVATENPFGGSPAPQQTAAPVGPPPNPFGSPAPQQAPAGYDPNAYRAPQAPAPTANPFG